MSIIFFGVYQSKALSMHWLAPQVWTFSLFLFSVIAFFSSREALLSFELYNGDFISSIHYNGFIASFMVFGATQIVTMSFVITHALLQITSDAVRKDATFEERTQRLCTNVTLLTFLAQTLFVLPGLLYVYSYRRYESSGDLYDDNVLDNLKCVYWGISFGVLIPVYRMLHAA